jgi:GDP-4-dehydro-6-deoxy-D-mannose reductase
VFNVCSGQPRSIQEVADALCAFAPEPVRLRVDPALIRPEEVPIMVGSGKKARDRFGFEPRFTLKDALLAAWRGWGQS